MHKKDCTVVIGGEAGQGLVTVGTLLSKTLNRSGYSILVTQSYQSRIRGGHNTYAVRFGNEEILAPTEPIDILIALDENTVNVNKDSLSENGLIIVDEGMNFDHPSLLKVPYKQLGSAKLLNTAAFGVVASLLGLDEHVVSETLHQFFGKKDPAVSEENERVLKSAYAWGKEHKTKVEIPPRPQVQKQRLMMNGNEAIALGAISAGVKFCSFYPMTPSTTVPLSLIPHAKEAGIIVEQVEDEIAAINMAIGASYTGAPSMVASAGGGFALMVEGVSLAAMTETPLVIVVAQRPAPATGLPTRTEQGDFLFVLNSGHGEFAKAIFAPTSVEECFTLTRKAFEIAEHSQGPVFILTDQFLADSYRAIEPFDTDKLATVKVGSDPSKINAPYKRYAITENGVSPRLLPGQSKHLVVADSDEHDEVGHLTEDLGIRKRMVEKRLRKYKAIYNEVIQPHFEGDTNPDTLLVCWGSTRGAAVEAAETMRSHGKKVATLSFPQLWPVVPHQFLDRLNSAKEAVIIEGNATGQFARILRSQTGFQTKKTIFRYDGLPITPEFILNNL